MTAVEWIGNIEIKFSQSAESEAQAKRRFERKLANDLRVAFKQQIQNFIRSYGLTRQLPNLADDTEILANILFNHYVLVSRRYSKQLRRKMPQRLKMTEVESQHLDTVLAGVFRSRSEKQSRFMNSTTVKIMDRAIKFAIRDAEDDLNAGGNVHRFEVATEAGALFGKRMLNRIPGIACYETQWSAEYCKFAEAMILIGNDPTSKAVKKPQALKQWDAMGDSRMRDWHADADGIQVPIDQPYRVNNESLMYPGDTSLGATASNVINCRCSSNINVTSVIEARQDLPQFKPAGQIIIGEPLSLNVNAGLEFIAKTKIQRTLIVPKKPKMPESRWQWISPKKPS